MRTHTHPTSTTHFHPSTLTGHAHTHTLADTHMHVQTHTYTHVCVHNINTQYLSISSGICCLLYIDKLLPHIYGFQMSLKQNWHIYIYFFYTVMFYTTCRYFIRAFSAHISSVALSFFRFNQSEVTSWGQTQDNTGSLHTPQIRQIRLGESSG